VTPEQIALLTPEERRSLEVFAGAHPDSTVVSALTTIANLRADYATVQARHTRAWEALCAIGDAVDKAGHYTLIPERALQVGVAVDALIAERDELRARLATGIGLPLGVNDRDGNPVHVGDTLAFNGEAWWRGHDGDRPDHIYTVTLDCGEICVDGTVGDIPHYCRVVKRWDAPTTETT